MPVRARRPRAWVPIVLIGLVAGCLPRGTPGTLAPTLVLEEVEGAIVAHQNGTPVPDFGWQPRPRLDLGDAWRVEPADFDPALTMTDRAVSLPAIESEAAGRQEPSFDDTAWETIEVPGTTNPPPDGREGGAWYRRSFDVPASWSARGARLAFGSANYVADVWLNGAWLGYHEGGRTPFAFDVGDRLQPGAENIILVRVHAIPPGSRSDVLPWGLIDWWNYGGITGPVWLEAVPETHVTRADVVPHLDAIDIAVQVHRTGRVVGRDAERPATEPPAAAALRLEVSILPAVVTDESVLDPDPRALVADGAEPIVRVEEAIDGPTAGSVSTTAVSIGFGDADLWAPERPSLYVLRVVLDRADPPADAREAAARDVYWTTFGVRTIGVDPAAPRLLLNGEQRMLRGVGLHAESLRFDADGALVGGSPAQPPSEVLRELEDARRVGADFIRAGHEPADPTLLMLADRLGFAVWEEIPLYHATPLIFERTMERGVPQQMLREMALRDMNRPSVLFHGLANESTGQDERRAALEALRDVDREIDGTRLTGQAAYGWNPTDPTQAVLDVAGYTSYQGVFYGERAGPDTRRFLREAHDAHPALPILVLEFGRWADTPADEDRQRRIFRDTEPALLAARGDRADGYVGAATWWTLHDFATRLSGVIVEDFGLYRPDGSLRPAGELAVERAGAVATVDGPPTLPEPDLERVRPPREPRETWRLLGWLGYGLGTATAALVVVLALLLRRGGRAVARR